MISLRYTSQLKEYRNENEIVIYCPGRSGQHAIVNWIASMCKSPVFFLNNCPIGDPYKTKIRSFYDIFPDLREFYIKMPILYRFTEGQISLYRNAPKQYLLYSYEHQDIRLLKEKDFVSNRNATLGRSRDVHSVLLLRDVFNWLASHVARKRRNLYRLTGLWEHYAREFLGETDYIKGNKVCISFNRWFQDQDYRIGIADLLGLKYSGRTFKYQGSASGFDGFQEYKKRAPEMKVFDRWKVLKDHRRYRKILHAYPQSCELSRRIFGGEIGDFNGLLDNG